MVRWLVGSHAPIGLGSLLRPYFVVLRPGSSITFDTISLIGMVCHMGATPDSRLGMFISGNIVFMEIEAFQLMEPLRCMIYRIVLERYYVNVTDR